jgi:hypothetical protein
MKQSQMIFRIYYKAFYGPNSEECYDDLRASDKQDALAKFYRRKKIKDGRFENPDGWRWWENDYFMAYKTISQIKLNKCPACGNIICDTIKG